MSANSSTESSKDSEPHPSGSSLWTSMPADVQPATLSASGSFALFVNGMLDSDSRLLDDVVCVLWRDAITLDWQGDLQLLPDAWLGSDSHGGLLLVKTRSMSHRLRARLPEQDSNQHEFLESIDRFSAGEFNTLPMDACLLHVPVCNGWWDLLDCQHAIALGWMAIAHGYTGLLCHLVKERSVDLEQYDTVDDYAAMDKAACNGHLAIVQMLHEAGSAACTTRAMDHAAACGHLDVIVWLHRHWTEGCTWQAMANAAKHGHLAVVEFLHLNSREGDADRAALWARKKGNDHIASWLHEHPRHEQI